MLVELNKDPLFVVTESPIKAIKEKELQRKKQLREDRVNPQPRLKELDKQIVDPLPLELKSYKEETSVRRSVETSKASDNLKKYVIQQERNLRCLRLDRITPQEKLITSRLKSMTLNMEQIEEEDKNSKEIHIPRVEDLFKHQAKEIMAYENQSLRTKLGDMMTKLDTTIHLVKEKAKKYLKSSKGDRGHQSLAIGVHGAEQDFEIDKLIEKRLEMSRRLQDKLYKEKREMGGRAPGETNGKNASKGIANNMSYFLRDLSKPKKKVQLEGVRTHSYSDGDRKLRITNASILLFEMNKLNKEKRKKQFELTGLLKNSYQNRDTILREKQVFYQSESTFNQLSPSKQFQLRKVMNQKLNHRLEISKEQVNKFISYLYEVKNYHVILNQTILDILKEVRLALLKGKVMKIADFQEIVASKNPEDLRQAPNDLIIRTLTEMMI